MYVNGNIVNIQNSGGQIVNTNFATNNNLYVGLNTHVWEEFHNGAVDDIRIYNRALKKAEVDILFNE
jgi:hypothetical protein